MAHFHKIALQVAIDMSHAATCLATLRKVENSSAFLATRNATFCCRCRLQKWGVTREIFLAICLAKFVARQVAGKIASCNMAFNLSITQAPVTQATRDQGCLSRDFKTDPLKKNRSRFQDSELSKNRGETCLCLNISIQLFFFLHSANND